MEIRNLSPKTIKTYVSYISVFTRHFGVSPDKLTDNDIRFYLNYLLTEKRAGFLPLMEIIVH